MAITSSRESPPPSVTTNNDSSADFSVSRGAHRQRHHHRQQHASANHSFSSVSSSSSSLQYWHQKHLIERQPLLEKTSTTTAIPLEEHTPRSRNDFLPQRRESPKHQQQQTSNNLLFSGVSGGTSRRRDTPPPAAIPLHQDTRGHHFTNESTTTSTSNTTQPSHTAATTRRWSSSIILLGCVISMTSLKGSRSLIGASLPFIKNENHSESESGPHLTNFRVGVLMAMATMIRVVGKFFWGFALDSGFFNAKTWLLICHASITCLVFLLGTSFSFGTLALWWCIFMFFYAIPTPVITKIVSQWYHTKAEHNFSMSTLTLSASLGQFFILISSAFIMNNLSFSWRGVFCLYPFVVMAGFLWVFFFLKESPEEKDGPSSNGLQADATTSPPSTLSREATATASHNTSQLAAVREFLSSGRFWMMGLATALSASLAEMHSLLPLYYVDELGVSASNAVYSAAPYTVGMLLALTYTRPYDWMDSLQKLFFLSLGNWFISGGFLLLAIWPQLHYMSSMVILFLIGYFIGWLCHVPTNMFIMQNGGAHIAKLSSLQSIFQFVCITLFYLLTGYLIRDGTWSHFFLFCCGISFLSTAAFGVFFVLEIREEMREKRQFRHAPQGARL